MKLRPQINGPIDVGHGNYILTAPADRNGRREEEDPTDDDTANGRESRTMKETKRNPDGKLDVAELLSSANTLTRPINNKQKSEL